MSDNVTDYVGDPTVPAAPGLCEVVQITDAAGSGLGVARHCTNPATSEVPDPLTVRGDLTREVCDFHFGLPVPWRCTLGPRRRGALSVNLPVDFTNPDAGIRPTMPIVEQPAAAELAWLQGVEDGEALALRRMAHPVRYRTWWLTHARAALSEARGERL